jgi:hydrogenase maturation protease
LLTTVHEKGDTILVIGLGNPILGDDGVGWRVAEAIAQRIGIQPLPSVREPGSPAVEVDCLALGGLGLMERMVGYPRAILIDAMNSHTQPVGSVSFFPLEALPNRAAGHLFSAHDTTLQNAIAVGRAMGVDLPDEVMVVTVEAENVYDFSEELSPAVSAAVPQAVQVVLELLGLSKEATHDFT